MQLLKWGILTSIPKKRITSAVVIHYCAWYSFFGTDSRCLYNNIIKTKVLYYGVKPQRPVKGRSSGQLRRLRRWNKNVNRLSGTAKNDIFYRFRWHHPLITQLNPNIFIWIQQFCQFFQKSEAHRWWAFDLNHTNSLVN